MVVEYLLTAGTPFGIAAVHALLEGTALGVTEFMAAAFKDAAGCGNLRLTAYRARGIRVVGSHQVGQQPDPIRCS